jgi:hypothetical protein
MLSLAVAGNGPARGYLTQQALTKHLRSHRAIRSLMSFVKAVSFSDGFQALRRAACSSSLDDTPTRRFNLETVDDRG